ncbi:MAG: hypothetical protein RMZ41_010745 [Nostoc sp. DedVER02]|nr:MULTISPECIES: hypothetical protein [unclassified Nostoc]MDZ7986284.1 hypothetical protein [Nostoc sp. DedVER02]MDZ8112674.1 hypothetical protein [Nostoc sp. DedVER01b]
MGVAFAANFEAIALRDFPKIKNPTKIKRSNAIAVSQVLRISNRY